MFIKFLFIYYFWQSCNWASPGFFFWFRKKNIKSDEKLNDLYQSLKEINAKLWVIEDDKRQCEKDKDFGEKFIKLSRDVHFLNDDRAKIKLEINNHTGSSIKEIKEYTSY